MDRLRQFEERLEATAPLPERLASLNDLALALTRAGDAEHALPFAREARELAAASKDDFALSQALVNISTCQYLAAEYGAGLESSLQALVLAERCGDAAAKASALMSAAACEYQMGAREEALQALYEAHEAIERVTADHLWIRLHNSLGILLGDKGRFDDAERHYRLAMELGESSGDAIYTPRVKMNYAGLHLDLGRQLARQDKRDEATARYREGLRLCEELLVGPGLESTFNKAHCVGTLGELYRETGQVELALQLFNEMLAHGVELKNPHQQAEALLNIGRTHMMRGHSAEARDCFERALHLASGANVRRLVTEGFRSLAEWFEAHSEFEQALAYQKRFQVLHDELLREELEASGTAREIWMKFHQDLSDRVDHLTRAAHEDSLTGLANRRCWDERIAGIVGATRRDGARTCVGIIDIDHFKSVNDLRSHLLGDEVLRTVADMIRGHCREGDVCARYGGDEFVLCLAGANLDDALGVLGRLRSLVARHSWSTLHPALAVTVSVGVAEVFEGDTPATLMERVDLALYKAKESGRDCVVVDAARYPDACASPPS
ncbi:MAG TPA: GGDEF domain-containing protein [Usitatibacter sp.]|nr:GGDEF domain-containing protein [Usitatibacter sp.]